MAVLTRRRPARSPAYHDGKSEDVLGRALVGKRDQGRFELYKVFPAYDNPEAREAHRFPVDPKEKEISEKEKKRRPSWSRHESPAHVRPILVVDGQPHVGHQKR